MEVNSPRTKQLQADPVYTRYLEWLREHGCLCPFTEYPVAFGSAGLVGVMATVDIPPRTDFLVVPYSLTINIKLALTSEIGPILHAHPHWFSRQLSAGDHILWMYLIFERCKGTDSKWFPYFETIKDVEILTDWTQAELEELQDPVLKHDAQAWQRRMDKVWAGFEPILHAHPEQYPPTQPLHTFFEWAWRLTSTRSFAWEGGMLVPLADNINHADCPIFYEFKAREPLILLPEHAPIQPRVYANRLEKYLLEFQELPVLESLWDLEAVLEGYQSESDDEAVRCYGDIDSEEETDDEYVDDYLALDDLTGLDFVMTTDYYTKFKQGEQVLQAYGRLSNRELLIDYGFALPHNKYDATYFRLWKPETGHLGLMPAADLCAQHYKSAFPDQSLEDLTELQTFKLGKLNTAVFEYFRKILTPEQVKKLTGELSIDYKEPSSLTVERYVLSKVNEICNCLQEQFSTSAEADCELLRQLLSPRLQHAVVYRLAQKRIVQRQIDLLARLDCFLAEVETSQSFDVAFEVEELPFVYPLTGYLRLLKTNCQLSDHQGVA